MLQNLRILVCNRCLDIPQEQLRAIVLPPDPQPIINARPELYAEDSTDYMTLSGSTIDPLTGIPVPNTTTMATVTGQTMNKQPLGPTSNPRSNIGLDRNAQMPLVDAIKWGVPIAVLSMTVNAVGSFSRDFSPDFDVVSFGQPTIVTVTCSKPHGLSTNSQVAINGTLVAECDGFFNVSVVNPMVFRYMVNGPLKVDSVLGTNTIVVTADAGVPWNFVQIPQAGIGSG